MASEPLESRESAQDRRELEIFGSGSEGPFETARRKAPEGFSGPGPGRSRGPVGESGLRPRCSKAEKARRGGRSEVSSGCQSDIQPDGIVWRSGYRDKTMIRSGRPGSAGRAVRSKNLTQKSRARCPWAASRLPAAPASSKSPVPEPIRGNYFQKISLANRRPGLLGQALRGRSSMRRPGSLARKSPGAFAGTWRSPPAPTSSKRLASGALRGDGSGRRPAARRRFGLSAGEPFRRYRDLGGQGRRPGARNPRAGSRRPNLQTGSEEPPRKPGRFFAGAFAPRLIGRNRETRAPALRRPGCEGSLQAPLRPGPERGGLIASGARRTPSLPPPPPPGG